MSKRLYFRVEPGCTYDGQLAGVNCRFREGRVYEVSERNPQLCAAIRAGIDNGHFVELPRAEALDLLDQQTAADRRKKNARKLELARLREYAASEGISLQTALGRATARVATGAAEEIAAAEGREANDYGEQG